MRTFKLVYTKSYPISSAMMKVCILSGWFNSENIKMCLFKN